ncbi:MAG: hypothetical protein KBF32_00680 [Chitinophagales bacterium]|nr:hypothetical protein [Chitinophagales bacterium]
MNDNKVLDAESVRQLREAATCFNADWPALKLKLLKDISQKSINKVNVLIDYHDCLLFLLAYPETYELFALSKAELKRVSVVTKALFTEGNERIRHQLSGTGIANTPVHVTFGFELASWLVQRFPQQVSILECAGIKAAVNEIFLLLLPATEREYFERQHETFSQFISRLKGDSQLTDLQWLLQFIERAHLQKEVRDYLYDQLKIYITWMTDEESPSRTFARSLHRTPYFHKAGLNKRPDSGSLIGQLIDKPKAISPYEKLLLITATRGILAMLQRETDPATYADVEKMQIFNMGKGIDIVLYPMVEERRLPFDVYIGYTLFKNRLPVAYGGGWIFQQRCKIGVNVLDAYRGGESGYLFLQVLRLFNQYYSIKRFVVEPYQIGFKNTEGLKSGAFWFYYRLGFVPESETLRTVADEEFKRIMTERSYRTSLKVLKALSVDNMQLTLDSGGYQQLDTSEISKAITGMIGKQYQGDRKKAISEAIKSAYKWLQLDDMEKSKFTANQVIENFALLLQLFPNRNDWDVVEKSALKQLILSKAFGNERDYLALFRKHRKLNETLAICFE